MLDYNAMESGFIEREPGDFGETDTYSMRAWGWVPAVASRPEEHGLGMLTIELTRGKKLETDQYIVTELEPLPGLVGRRFELAPVGKDYVYPVVLGGLKSCGCMAGQTRGKHEHPCKHLEAVQLLVDKGFLKGANHGSGSSLGGRGTDGARQVGGPGDGGGEVRREDDAAGHPEIGPEV